MFDSLVVFCHIMYLEILIAAMFYLFDWVCLFIFVSMIFNEGTYLT